MVTQTPPRRLNRYTTFEVAYLIVGIPLYVGYQQWKQGKLCVAAMLWIAAALHIYAMEQTTMDPPNSAYYFIRDGGNNNADRERRPTLVCLGDSITHGRCSCNWVSNTLPSRLKRQNQPIEIVNNAQNSITTYTILQERVDWTLACEPEFCVVLIGTNDARALVDPPWQWMARLCWGLPGPITEASIEANLRGIVEKLLKKRDLKVAICTIPPLGEDLTTCWNRDAAEKVNAIIRKVVGETKCDDERVALLDLNQALESEIRQSSSLSSSGRSSMAMFWAHVPWQAYGRHIFGLEWNTMSNWLGNTVLTDAIHLNDTGGDVLSGLVADWLALHQQGQAVKGTRRR